jgi:hypothetical protein
MVKNSTGGNKSKGFARKNMTKRESALRIAREDGEIYAQAVKVLGGAVISAIDVKGNPLRGHIRGKFRGRGKKDNFISPNVWLLVGLHSWEDTATTSSTIRNCDILEVYTDADKARLKNSVTSIDWSKFISNDTKALGKETDHHEEHDFIFSDEATQEYENLVFRQATESASAAIMVDDVIIDIDDI